MAEPSLPQPDALAFDNVLRAQALALHTKDQPPPNLEEWTRRRQALRDAMFAAMGPFPEQPCPLEPRAVGVLERDGYRIEKLLFQSRPDIWVTAHAYVPERRTGKLPAVLAVHGHWPFARRDPVVQARCLGLVKLGFFVLAVDAFGAGERHTAPARGTYHGALYGSTLWPVGQTLLGMQVYDNRRAVDYLRSRPEVDGDRLGITGASGGGNQTMYAGALDERFRAVVPVCSVGTYQAYLHAACCVCEVLPGGLRFAEEGDVLGLVAPRALLVVSATRDAFQFSVAEAEKSLGRAQPIFRLYGAENKLKHAVFESPHDYNRAMREAMYGWMTLHLKGEGDGKPIPEPAHTVEQPEDLNCFPDEKRPKGFLFPPTFAAREGRRLLARLDQRKPNHAEDWESDAVALREQLRKRLLGDTPWPRKPTARLGAAETANGLRKTPLVLEPEPGLPLHAALKVAADAKGPTPAAVLLHFDGHAKALEHPVAAALLAKGWAIAAPTLRATGVMAPPRDAIAGAPDHNSAEHALWVGRPLLGQWLVDVYALLDWLALQPGLDRRRFAVVGVGQAAVVALGAVALLEDRIQSAALLDGPARLLTESAYAAGTRMGLLVPGILQVGDVPQLAALAAPRRLTVAGGVSPQGMKLDAEALRDGFAFTRSIYRVYKADDRLTVAEELAAAELADRL